MEGIGVRDEDAAALAAAGAFVTVISAVCAEATG